jgi:hypothetical protein
MLFDKMHLSTKLGLIAAIFFVLFIRGGIAAEGQFTDSGYSGPNLIQQVPLLAGIALLPGLEAKALIPHSLWIGLLRTRWHSVCFLCR